MKYLLDDATFEKIYQVLRGIKNIHIKNSLKLRRFIEAIYYMSRAGSSWRLLPYYYGDWRSVHKRFKSWSDQGIWQKIFKMAQINPDMEYVMIDSTIVRAHACSAGYIKNNQSEKALGRSAGGFTTKIHTLVDALGNPLEFIVTSGQKNDHTQAEQLTKNMYNTYVLADKGYSSYSFIKQLYNQNCVPIIPPKTNFQQPWNYDKHLYKERYLIECLFGKSKHFRRIFSRFDKSATSFLSFVQFVGALIWFK